VLVGLLLAVVSSSVAASPVASSMMHVPPEAEPPDFTDSDEDETEGIPGVDRKITVTETEELYNDVRRHVKFAKDTFNANEEEDIDKLTGWINGTVGGHLATTAMTRNERRDNPQRAGARTTIVP
jgi:hypothetical protein